MGLFTARGDYREGRHVLNSLNIKLKSSCFFSLDSLEPIIRISGQKLNLTVPFITIINILKFPPPLVKFLATGLVIYDEYRIRVWKNSTAHPTLKEQGILSQI